MANPNYGRKDIASAAYAKEKEIRSDWYEVPQKAVVPPELYYYAVDQKELDRKNREKPAAHRIVRDEKYPDADQVVLQAHRWLLSIPFKDNNGQHIPVGDWVIAERFRVHRGEIIGRTARVEVPVYRPQKETIVLLRETTSKIRNPGVEVNFGYDQLDKQEAILVDFEGGKQSYARVAGRSDDPDKKPDTRPIEDESSTDVLILTPDGKLVVHNNVADAKDEEREKRLKEVRENLQKWSDEGKILNNLLNNPGGAPGGAPGGPGGKGGNPFGGGR
jgi:hypothetical protein